DAIGQLHPLAGCRNGDFHIDHQNLVPGVSGNRQTSVARRKLHIFRAPQVGEGLPYLRGSSEVNLHADASPSLSKSYAFAPIDSFRPPSGGEADGEIGPNRRLMFV